MNLFYLLLSGTLFLSCTNNTPNELTETSNIQEPAKSKENPIKTMPYTTGWQVSFAHFIDAVIKLDKKEMKSFIDFPIKNEGNEIWYWIKPEFVMSISSDKIKPFTEKDFDQYYSQVFSYDLRKVMKELDLQIFFEKHTVETPEIVVVENSKTKLKAIYEDDVKKIVLILITNLAGEYPYSVANEFHFDVLPAGEIKFRQMRMQDSE